MQSKSTITGLCKTNKPEHNSWMNMIQRCANPKNPKYKYYGGRGITVCQRWRVFANFLADMGSKPTSKHSIDRINNNGDYEPNNCRWATQSEQMRNTRPREEFVGGHHAHLITFNGKTQHLTDWAIERGIGWTGLYQRLARGWSIERALTQSVQSQKRRSG